MSAEASLNLPVEGRRTSGFTLVELLFVVAIIALLAAISVPGLMRGRMSANEASAIASTRTISNAEATFASSCGGGGYAIDLADLATPPAGSFEAFIPADLGAADVSPKSGYLFNVADHPDMDATDILAVGESCNAGGVTRTRFFASADPLGFGSTGTRHFATDESAQIRQDVAALADMSAGQPLQ